MISLFDQALLKKIKQLGHDCSWHDFCVQMLKHLDVTQIKHNQIPPQKSPILLIGNHNSILDSLILGKLITRKDYYFVALASYSLLGPKIAKNTLPIYRRLMLNHMIFEYPLSLISHKPIGWLDKKTIQANNRDSIARAAEKINQGGIVSIFPTGSAGKKLAGGRWKSGVGYLAKQISHPDAKIMFCQISNTYRTDLMLFLHPVLKKNLYRKNNKPLVRFSPTIKLDKVVDTNLPAKQIALQLEHSYLAFTNQQNEDALN